MPLPGTPRQPEQAPLAGAWFDSIAGRAVLESEDDILRKAAGERPGQPWLRLTPVAAPTDIGERELPLHVARGAFDGPLRCALPLPIASECMGTVVLQHVCDGAVLSAPLLEEVARVLIPGGRLWLLALNPLAPYRMRWLRQGPVASEPVRWRRRLRAAGLEPEAVSQGIGPRWAPAPNASLQQGAGMRAAFLLRAEKRVVPLTPLRLRPVVRIANGVPAA